MRDRLFARLRGLLTRRRARREADEELTFHVEQETAANIARGFSPDEARRLALRDLGGVTQTREAIHDVRTLGIEAVWRDARHAVRSLRRTPAFTVSALATLALVIGANGAIFSLADAVLLRPLPYPNPERLARVSWLTRSAGTIGFSDSIDGRAWEAIRDETRTLDVALAGSGRERINFNSDASAAFVTQARISAGYFRVLGVTPAVGREFTPDEDRPGGAPVVMLTHDFWERLFQADPSAVGRTVFLRGEAYLVVGVLPHDFAPIGMTADVFTPLRPTRTGEGGGDNYSAIARLRDDHTWTDADGELASISRMIVRPELERAGATRQLAVEPLQDALTSGARLPLYLLAAAGAMVLLVACVNIAALTLARNGGRKQALSTRLALGSSRAALVRQFVVESLVLGAAGGALGLGVAHVCLGALQTIGGDSFSQWTSAVIDTRAAVVTAAVSMVTAVAFGLPAALPATRLDVRAAMTDGGSRSIAGGAHHWGRRVLIATEVALSVVLLVVTGLFVRTLVNLGNLDPGFDADRVTTTSVSLQDARYASAAAIAQLFDVSLGELERTPGVESAAVSLGLPYSRLLNFPFRFTGAPIDDQIIANLMYVTPGFFETLRIPLRSGRGFAGTDREGQPPVVVVNDAFVRFIAGSENPMGRSLTWGDRDWQIVGIAGDVQMRNSGVSHPGMIHGPIETPPIVFFPAAQMNDAFAQLVHRWFSPSWLIRTAGSTNADAVLRHAIESANPLLPITPADRLADAQAGATAFQRRLVILVGAFAAVALVLAVIGLYGLIAQAVMDRTHEIGIRMALGATPAGTIGRVTMSGVTVAAIDVVAGTALAAGAAQFVTAWLWGVDERDPLTFAAIAGLLLLVAAIASALPALRIVRIDPATILRG